MRAFGACEVYLTKEVVAGLQFVKYIVASSIRFVF